MYLAELHGKLSSRVERMEDILTSNVFSFFKYSNREVFLREYLGRLGFDVSPREAKEAEFMFWPYLEDTEPDVVIIVGVYYLLIEAKYFSGFAEETKDTKAQLLREIERGYLEAKNYGKQFRLIAITADHVYPDHKFKIIPRQFESNVTWTNWQSVAHLLDSILESGTKISEHERLFALDLYILLDKKNLRGFQSFDILYGGSSALKLLRPIFFEAKTAKHRGAFIGFPDALFSDQRMTTVKRPIFFSQERKMFSRLYEAGGLVPAGSPIFYEEGDSHER